MVSFYVVQIKLGAMELSDIPEIFREEVSKKL